MLSLAGCPPHLSYELTYLHQATLIREGLVDLVSPTRILFHDAPNAVKMLGKPTTSAVYSPFSFRQIAEFILFLPLNLIPVIGTPFFLLLTGARAGPLHHWRYFKLLGLSKKQRKEAIRRRGWKYTWYVIAGPGMRREMLTVFLQVWDCGLAAAACAGSVDVLSSHNSLWICALGCEAGGAEEVDR